MEVTDLSASMANEFCKKNPDAQPHYELLRTVFINVKTNLADSVANLNQNRDNYTLIFMTMKSTVDKAIVTRVYDKTQIDNTLKAGMTMAGIREARHENTRIALEAQIHTVLEEQELDADLCIKASRYGAETYMAEISKVVDRMMDSVSLVPATAGDEPFMKIEDMRSRRSLFSCSCTLL